MKKQLLSAAMAAALLGALVAPVAAQNLAIVNGKPIPKSRVEALAQRLIEHGDQWNHQEYA